MLSGYMTVQMRPARHCYVQLMTADSWLWESYKKYQFDYMELGEVFLLQFIFVHLVKMCLNADTI